MSTGESFSTEEKRERGLSKTVDVGVSILEQHLISAFPSLGSKAISGIEGLLIIRSIVSLQFLGPEYQRIFVLSIRGAAFIRVFQEPSPSLGHSLVT